MHTSVKKQQIATFIYHTIAMYVPERNISLKFHIYATCTTICIIQCTSVGEVCQYMCHIWTYFHHSCDQEHYTQTMTMMQDDDNNAAQLNKLIWSVCHISQKVLKAIVCDNLPQQCLFKVIATPTSVKAAPKVVKRYQVEETRNNPCQQ